jgi:hypothetical protein
MKHETEFYRYWGNSDVGLLNNNMEYRVTFKSMFGLTLLLSIFGFSFIAYTILYKKPSLIIPGVLLFVLLVVIRFRFKVVVDKKQVSYTGFFTTKVIMFSDIVHSGWMFEHGYSRDRFYGSFVYEILSKNTCIKINFRLFPIDTMSKVIETLEGLSRISISEKEPPSDFSR